MVSRKFRVEHHAGLHLKSATKLCTEAIKYRSRITLQAGENMINAKSVLNVLSACVKADEEITLCCMGEDEEEALKNLGELIENGL